MDCISGRKNQGRITGDVRVNGHPQVARLLSIDSHVMLCESFGTMLQKLCASTVLCPLQQYLNRS